MSAINDNQQETDDLLERVARRKINKDYEEALNFVEDNLWETEEVIG